MGPSTKRMLTLLSSGMRVVSYQTVSVSSVQGVRGAAMTVTQLSAAIEFGALPAI